MVAYSLCPIFLALSSCLRRFPPLQEAFAEANKKYKVIEASKRKWGPVKYQFNLAGTFGHYPIADGAPKIKKAAKPEKVQWIPRGVDPNKPDSHVVHEEFNKLEFNKGDIARAMKAPIDPKPGQESRYGGPFREYRQKYKLQSAHHNVTRHRRDMEEEERIFRLSTSLRLDRRSGLFVECDMGDPSLEVADVGIAWDSLVLRSQSTRSGIVQLRVAAMDPFGAARQSQRINVGDMLVSIDEEFVVGQSVGLQLSKIRGPIGSFVVRTPVLLQKI